MLDNEVVRACYRAFLGREPESDSVTQDTVARLATLEDLLREFIASTEFMSCFLKGYSFRLLKLNQGLSDKSHIDVDVSETQRRALFARLRAQWRALGDENPFWSVLSHDEYRTAQLDEDGRASFYDTGCDFAQLVDAFCRRNDAQIRRGTCVELGCGVGRVTIHLARRFEKVIAIDISEGNIQQCKIKAKQANINNVEYMLIRSPDELQILKEFDFFYSMLTLQHNPPPVQKYQLASVLSKIRQGGGFLFQTQTFFPGYQFSVDSYLESLPDEMDMHSLPMNEIFILFEKLGLRVREIAVDTYTGRQGSYSFFGLAGQ
jgi:2-polyprenyl-3-methyl-5-hydroxy-6-metoxy-1,4-benzoquinol methylase